ncbi:MAG: CPBP family intramembrane glutamic endopeptidase [Alphaproteobacteria bacterium]
MGVDPGVARLRRARRQATLLEIGLSLPRPSTPRPWPFPGALAPAAAVYLPGLPEARLERMPYGATMFFPPSNADDRLFWAFVAATAAICEEAMFRASPSASRGGRACRPVAALMSSAAFAYFHGGSSRARSLPRRSLRDGLALAPFHLRLKSIWPAVGVHFALDASVLAAS